MSSQIDQWAVPTEFSPAAQDVTFRPGRGGQFTNEEAAYMLNLWWAAKDKRLTFADAVRQTMVHFKVGEQP